MALAYVAISSAPESTVMIFLLLGKSGRPVLSAVTFAIPPSGNRIHWEWKGKSAIQIEGTEPKH